mmetsp:Transcript_70139/g.120456  ORF Transcript_70139/g.120456 Transcript_70139/m.120456 type:complete len:144 (+) Transcript_70139:622-1053(+)
MAEPPAEHPKRIKFERSFRSSTEPSTEQIESFWSKETTIENARDHLANERTFLAWVRTAIAVAALGLAVAKLAPEDGGTYAGIALLLLAGITLPLSGWRYCTVKNALQSGNFTILAGAVMIISLLGTFFVLAVAALILVQFLY